MVSGPTRWRDVFVVCHHARPGSPLAAALDNRAAWTVDQSLAADLVDGVAGLIWMLGAGKGPKPKPLRRPWDARDTTVQRFDGPAMTRAEVDAMVARFRPRRNDVN